MSTESNKDVSPSSKLPGATVNNGDQSWTVGKILTWSTAFLKEQGSPSPRLDAEILIAHTLGCSRIELYTTYEKPLAETERSPLRDLIRRRADGEPVAYLVGYRDFYQLRFAVTPDVLIPRPDTEVLVEQVVSWADGRTNLKILDVGTGSGCIGVSLGQRLSSDVTGWDVSEAALAVATGNADRHGVEFQGLVADMTDPNVWQTAGAFEVIVSNPPYVSGKDDPDLAEDVARYEPAHALYGGEDGLDFYRSIANHAARTLRPEGLLALEIGHDQATSVAELLNQAGWTGVAVIKDYGDLDRVVLATRTNSNE